MSNTDLLKRSSYGYELPGELIAQTPSEKRDMSRLLVLRRSDGETGDFLFRDIEGFLEPGDCLVINDTKVIPARLYGRSEGHSGEVETVLLRRTGEPGEVWECLTRPGKKTRPGDTVDYGCGVNGRVLGVGDGGVRRIAFDCEGSFYDLSLIHI